MQTFPCKDQGWGWQGALSRPSRRSMRMARPRIPLICLVREETVTLVPRDQGKVSGMLCVRLRVMPTHAEAEPFGEEFAQWGLAPRAALSKCPGARTFGEAVRGGQDRPQQRTRTLGTLLSAGPLPRGAEVDSVVSPFCWPARFSRVRQMKFGNRRPRGAQALYLSSLGCLTWRIPTGLWPRGLIRGRIRAAG